MQKFAYLLLTLATLFFAEHLLAQEIEYPSNKSILSANRYPGYYREREKNGIGISPLYYPLADPENLTPFRKGNITNGNYYFYDRTISSSFKLHFFHASEQLYDDTTSQAENSAGNLLYRSDNYGGACNFDGGSRPIQYCPSNVEYVHIKARIKRIGVSLRNFPFYESGFFWGIGGGPIEYYQDFFLQWSPSWPYTPSPLYFKGTQYFIDLGWQGYNGFYFTINTRIGSTSVTEEHNEPNTEYWEFTEKGRNWVMGKYEAAKNPRNIRFGFGWHL